MDTESLPNRPKPHVALKKHLGTFFFFSAAGLVVGFLMYGPVFAADFKSGRRKNCASRYKYVNPEPDCETLEDTIGRLQGVERDVDSIIDDALKKGKATRISVFARDLTTLRYVSVNELELYSPASLMKIPLMLAYFRIAESDPSILTKQLVYESGPNFNLNQEMQEFEEATQLVVGQSYSVENLIARMIKYSDNNATTLLLDNINKDYLERTLLEIGIRIPKLDGMGNRDFVTVKSFTALIRFLYNSTFLTRESSNKALQLLSESTFHQGMRFVVPETTVVAEKYGERSVRDENGTVLSRELHECGLVYSVGRPYTFCVFTEGKNYVDLLDTLRQIEKSIHQNVTQ